MKKKIDFKYYNGAKADFLAVLKLRNPQSWKELNNEISVYCACVGLPVVVAITFCEPEFPQYATELKTKKQIVIEFYNYEL